MSFFRSVRPLHMFFAVLTFLFGASLADYLGRFGSLVSFGLGLFIVILAQVTMNLLAEVFRLDSEPLNENETPVQRQILRNNSLYVSLACIAILSLAVYILAAGGHLSPPSMFFLFASALIAILYSIPPFRFVNRGLGELLLAVQLAYVVPSISFTLQTGGTHQFLALTIPLMFLAFSYFITGSFQSFAQDQRRGRVTLLTRLGWERVVPLHHAFLIFSYILLLSMPAFNLSFSVIVPAFLTLPFAVFQIYQLRAVSLGARPNWNLLHATALASFGLTVYLLTLTLWLR